MSITNLEEFCREFHLVLSEESEIFEIINRGRLLLSQLVDKSDWFRDTLSSLVLNEEFLNAQWLSIDSNEVILYRSPDRAFSVRAYIWEPNVVYPVHDHGAWGIVGSLINQIKERKFKRIDDGSVENRAQIKQISEATLSPGGTTFVLPVNQGIHQMEAINDQVAITIHVYGKPVRKGYIQFFDINSGNVQRVYPPRLYKKIMAMRALGDIPETWSEEILNKALNISGPDHLLLEGKLALEKLKGY
jgi:predicted metal-dependent enzyme (double-stranded beta helix superfamily)